MRTDEQIGGRTKQRKYKETFKHIKNQFHIMCGIAILYITAVLTKLLNSQTKTFMLL